MGAGEKNARSFGKNRRNKLCGGNLKIDVTHQKLHPIDPTPSPRLLSHACRKRMPLATNQHVRPFAEGTEYDMD